MVYIKKENCATSPKYSQLRFVYLHTDVVVL